MVQHRQAAAQQGIIMSDYEVLHRPSTLTLNSLAGGLFEKESDKEDGHSRWDCYSPVDPCLRRGAGEDSCENHGDPKRLFRGVPR